VMSIVTQTQNHWRTLIAQLDEFSQLLASKA
jgi:hypothetical protein